MTDRELFEKALEALEEISGGYSQNLIVALKERLAQPEQEPVAWAGVDFAVDCTPPRREWVGLTDEVIWLEYQRFWPFHSAEEPILAKDIVKFARAIEAKLREKNT